MSMQDDTPIDLVDTFRDETIEQLSQLEEALLELESNPESQDHIALVFRIVHTIKGSGNMAGFNEMVRFTHDLETVFDRVRSGELSICKELLTLTLTAKDHLQALLSAGPNPEEDVVTLSNHILSQLSKFLETPKTEPTPDSKTSSPNTTEKDHTLYWIRYRPDANTLLSGTNPLGLLEELSELGCMNQFHHLGDIPNLDTIEPHKVYGWWDILLNTDKDQSTLEDVFLFIMDDGGVVIHPIGSGCLRASDQKELLEICRSTDEDSNVIRSNLVTAHSKLQSEIEKKRKAYQKANKENGKNGKSETTSNADNSTSLRVDSGRLDHLVDMVGELVILQSRLSMAVKGTMGQLDGATLTQISEDMERLAEEMRHNALSLRMLPIGTSFGTLKRLVRDLASKLGKDVELVTEGAETELDKTVIDRLKDPLMHILRNAIDHGIESIEDRQASNKPTKGTITLSAVHSGGDVLIKVSDNGKGIDPEKIRAKAVERGLISDDADLNHKELIALLFEPGFSTAEKVSDLSGRGVGMDVVKKSITDLRGHVEIDSQIGQGTLITVRLPLTLAIIDGLQVQIGQESFIIPLASVDACQERTVTDDVPEVDSIERMGRLIPCISLRKKLQVPGKQPDYERIVIANVEGMAVGMAVDKVIGRQQAVIKSLSQIYRNLDWISGTTINGEGGVSLILDVPQIIRSATLLATTGTR